MPSLLSRKRCNKCGLVFASFTHKCDKILHFDLASKSFFLCKQKKSASETCFKSSNTLIKHLEFTIYKVKCWNLHFLLVYADFNCGPTQNALLYTVVPDLCLQKLTKISWNRQIDGFFWSQMFSLVTLIAEFYVKTSYQSFQNYIDLTKFFVKSPEIRRQSYQNLTEKVNISSIWRYDEIFVSFPKTPL